MFSNVKRPLYKKDIFLLGIFVFLPIYQVYEGFTPNLLNFSLIFSLSTFLILYYLIAFRYNKKTYIKAIAILVFIPLYFMYLLMLYSFIFNKDYTWKDLNVDNFKKPLIFWLEEELKVLQDEKNQKLKLVNIQNLSTIENSDSEERYRDTDEEEIQAYDADDAYDDAYANYESENQAGYHLVEGYTRSDGTEVDSYVRGNPDGVEENNIEYMRDHDDQNGLEQAYSSVFD